MATHYLQACLRIPRFPIESHVGGTRGNSTVTARVADENVE